MGISQERVVITGWGAATAFGLGGRALLDGMLRGESRVRPLPPPRDQLRPGYGAIVELEAKDLRSLPNSRDMRPGTMTRYTYLSTFALGNAMAHGNVPWDDGDGALRRGAYIATYTNSDRFDKYVQLAHHVTRPGADGKATLVDARVPDAIRKFTGFEFLKLMNNMPAAHGAIEARCQGPCNTFLGTPSGALQAIGRAAEVLRDGMADTMYAGGTGSAAQDHMMMNRAMRKLCADPAADPATAARPWDRGATGIVPGEGGAMLALEREATARARGASIRAELAGHGDWFQAPSGHRELPADERGAVRAAERALAMAGIGVADLDLVVAHGESRPDLDALEARGLRTLLGAHGDRLPIVSLTAHLGSTEGAAGALSCVLALECMGANVIPADLHREQPIDEFPGKTRTQPTEGAVRHALVWITTREGVNAAVVLRRLDG